MKITKVKEDVYGLMKYFMDWAITAHNNQSMFVERGTESQLIVWSQGAKTSRHMYVGSKVTFHVSYPMLAPHHVLFKNCPFQCQSHTFYPRLADTIVCSLIEDTTQNLQETAM